MVLTKNIYTEIDNDYKLIKNMSNILQRLFHGGDPGWAWLGKPRINKSEKNPFPDNGGMRDMTNGSKLALGVGVIAGGSIGGPIGIGIAAGCVGIGVGVGVLNSHLRQRRLDNLQSFAGDINARARTIKHKFELDTHHSCNHDHHHHDHHKHPHDNCGDKITHGITHPLHDGKKGFVAINTVRYSTNVISGARASSSLVVREIANQSGRAAAETVTTAVSGVGMANDAAIAGIDGARAHYYAYHIYNEEYQRYLDIVKKRDKKSQLYYSSGESFDLVKSFLLQQDCKNIPQLKDLLSSSSNIDEFLKNATEKQKKHGKDTLPVTSLAFFMMNFVLISESKKESISEDRINAFVQESYDHFKVRERKHSVRNNLTPHRNDLISYVDSDGSAQDISLRSWQVHQQLEFDKTRILSLLDPYIGFQVVEDMQQLNYAKVQEIKEKIDALIDQNLQKTIVGRIQYQHIYNTLMVEVLELGGLDLASQTLDKLSDTVRDNKLSPTLIRENYSKHTYGHPHQELDGYAQKPSKLLGALAHNIPFAEIGESLSSLVCPPPPAVGEQLKYDMANARKKITKKKITKNREQKAKEVREWKENQAIEFLANAHTKLPSAEPNPSDDKPQQNINVEIQEIIEIKRELNEKLFGGCISGGWRGRVDCNYNQEAGKFVITIYPEEGHFIPKIRGTGYSELCRILSVDKTDDESKIEKHIDRDGVENLLKDIGEKQREGSLRCC